MLSNALLVFEKIKHFLLDMLHQPLYLLKFEWKVVPCEDSRWNILFVPGKLRSNYDQMCRVVLMMQRPGLKLPLYSLYLH